MKSRLAQAVERRPFPEFAQWWQMGPAFVQMMSGAIIVQWIGLKRSKRGLRQVQTYLAEYLALVYDRGADPGLVGAFAQHQAARTFFSGEFDALSYAFYRDAFETLAHQYGADHQALIKERRRFAKQVGRRFFVALNRHLQPQLPSDLQNRGQLSQLQSSLDRITIFLGEQGYLRDGGEFTFKVDIQHAGKRIQQTPAGFLDRLHYSGKGYGLYIMGYPAILPSAVYLFQLFGEAQHHSSRMIEELFGQMGYQAHEAESFDPSQFPSDKVVELWTIRSRRGRQGCARR